MHPHALRRQAFFFASTVMSSANAPGQPGDAPAVETNKPTVQETSVVSARPRPTAEHAPLPDDCDPESSSAVDPCQCGKDGPKAGGTVYAMAKLKARSGDEVEANPQGSVVEVSCDQRRPSFFLVRWDKQPPRWHHATEIIVDPSIPL